MFERAVAAYTGAPHAVAVDSCTNALFLCLTYLHATHVELPTHTYAGVAMAAKAAGCTIRWRDETWNGCYRLRPLPLWDAAKRFRRGMYLPGQFVCVSFHASKILNIGQGGAILMDNAQAVPWFRRARFDGRSEGVHPLIDPLFHAGWHCYMTPPQAAEGLWRLMYLPDAPPDQPRDEYPDLSSRAVFRG